MIRHLTLDAQLCASFGTMSIIANHITTSSYSKNRIVLHGLRIWQSYEKVTKLLEFAISTSTNLACLIYCISGLLQYESSAIAKTEYWFTKCGLLDFTYIMVYL